MCGASTPARTAPCQVTGKGRLALFLALLVPIGACAHRPRPVVRPPTAPTAASVVQLRAKLDRLFHAPAFERVLWGVDIQSLETGEIIYRLNPAKFVMPASNMKILTMAAAAERLGWDFTFETRLTTSAPIEEEVLRGDLVVIGSGDPTINSRGGTQTPVFEQWAGALVDAGIRRIDGRIVGDDNFFDDEVLGAGWAWDYLAAGYAAPVGALEYNEDVIELVFRAGADVGQPVSIDMSPPESGLTLLNHVATVAKDGETSVVLRRLPGQAVLEARGTVAAGTAEFTRTASVDNPTGFFVRALRATLIAKGIEVRGEAVDIDETTGETPQPADIAQQRVLAAYRSAPLSEIGTQMMKTSQNLYAETLFRTLGARGGSGTSAGGRKAVEDVLTSWGIAPDSYVMADGSGLSRYNYVTAETLVAILRRMWQDPRHASVFEATLPVAGRDGTLSGRMKGTRAEGNVRAKTGSIANARALSGYLRTLGGELVVFSIIANHFNAPPETIDATVDLALENVVDPGVR